MIRCPFLLLIIRCFWLSCIFLITHHSLLITIHAQSSTATFSGTVRDPNNAAIPGAHIAVTNTATGLKREGMTNSAGGFTISLLPPSTYTVLVENAGFTPAEINDVVLNVNDNVTLNIQLKIGQVGATVDVRDETPLINESSAVGTVVDRQFVSNLPLNERSFQSLFELTPGVVLTKATSTEQGQFSVNGQRANAICRTTRCRGNSGRKLRSRVRQIIYVPPTELRGSFISGMNVVYAIDRRNDRLYVVTSDDREGSRRMLLSYSSDRGRTWSAPMKVSPDVPAASAQYQPMLAGNHEGTVGVAWFDTRDAPNRDSYHLYFTASVDGGDSFLPARRVSSEPSLPINAINLVPFQGSSRVTKGNLEQRFRTAFGRWGNGGDYMGFTADADGFFRPLGLTVEVSLSGLDKSDSCVEAGR